jgi:sporulation protein YlmC with PRC-barrel domain
VIRLTDLRGKQVRTLDGKRLGKVHDVHCVDGKVTALMVGAASFIEQLTAKRHGHRIPWECVRKIEPDRIIATPERPKRGKA